MKVALIHRRHTMTGGSERYLNGMASHLAALQHEVTIVCQRHEAAPHPAVRFAPIRAGGIGSAHRMVTFARAVERHVRQASYDVVLALGKTWTHDVIRMGGGCHRTYMALAHRAAVRSWVRRATVEWYKSRIALAIEARALAPGASRRVITNSEMVKRDVMTRYGIPSDLITVVRNGVDLERFHPCHRRGRGFELRRMCGFGTDQVVVVFLASGFGRKGLDRLLDVFPALLRQRPEARLLVVGHDSALEYWRAYAQQLGLARYVVFLGRRDDPEVCYGAGDVYVLPTRYDPAANTTLEALASGLPVITTTANGGSEVMEQGVHGTVLQNAAAEALLQALVQWIDLERCTSAAPLARTRAERYGRDRELAASTRVLIEAAAAKQ